MILTCLPDPDSSPIVDGILLVVNGGVVPDVIEVFLKLLHGGVLVSVDFLSHRAKIHRVFDDVKVVRDLTGREGGGGGEGGGREGGRREGREV